MIEVMFAISLFFNLFLILYARWLLSNYKGLVEMIDVTGEKITEFLIHLKNVYELEMFYGDQTLSSLLDHGKSLMLQLEEIEMIGKNDEDADTSEYKNQTNS